MGFKNVCACVKFFSLLSSFCTFFLQCFLQEERIATLEKRYLNAQRESTSLHDLNEKLEQELQHKEAQLKLQEEKTRAIQEKLDLSDQKLAQFSKLPDMEEELKLRLHALTQVSFFLPLELYHETVLMYKME